MATLTRQLSAANAQGGNAKSLLFTVTELINDLVASNNESRTDHLGSGTSYKVWSDEVDADHEIGITWMTEVDSDLDSINNYNHFQTERDGVIGGDFAFTAGGVVTLTGAGRVEYQINGVRYVADVDTTITLEDNGDIAQNNFGAWRVLIDRAGVVTTQDTAGSGAMAFSSAEDALLSLSQRAISANTVEIGYLTLTDSNSVINIGTDNLNASGVTTVIYTVTGPRLGCGLNAALGATITVPNGAGTWGSGTIDARVEGGSGSGAGFSRNLSQISAISTQAMDDADTVGINQFGGWLLVTDPAFSGVYALAANGIAGSVTAMTYSTSALRDTALDEVQDRLPAICAVIGRILLANGSGAGNAWVAGTDNWDHDTATATRVDYTSAGFDRTALVGNVGKEAPAVPASVSAPLVATLTASVPAAHGASAIDDISVRPGGSI